MFELFLPIENSVKAPSIIHEYVVEARQDTSWNIPLHEIAASHLESMSPEALDNDWKLQEFFPTIIVINLPQAEPRLKRFTQEINAIGTGKFEIFSAIDGRKDLPQAIWGKMVGNRDSIKVHNEKGKEALVSLHKGEAGCYMSHYLALKGVKEKFDEAYKDNCAAKTEKERNAAASKLRKYSRVLIFEDDTGFGLFSKHDKSTTKIGAGTLLRHALKDLPKSWDLLYFIVHPTEPTKQIAPHLYRLRRSWCAAAYAVNYKMYEPLLRKLEKIEDPLTMRVLPVDAAISRLHGRHKTYAVYPSLVYHHPGESQISSKSKHWPWQGQPIYKRNKK